MNNLQLNNLSDFLDYFEFEIRAIRTWFENIKIYDGKKMNYFLRDGQVYDENETLNIILENHQHWQELKGLNQSKLDSAVDETNLKLKRKEFLIEKT